MVKIINKADNLSWRKLQIINPILYVILVITITTEENWNLITNKIKEYQNKVKDKIFCSSIPFSNDKNIKNKISSYLKNFENKTIQLSLEYNYIIKTDISNCYDSIYTHSISWAIYGKENVKKVVKKKDNDNKSISLGEEIDNILRSMSYGQSNGIPQGSVIMDFICEILLSYVDLELFNKINKNNNNIDYKILRYRDDYRILTKNYDDGVSILKALIFCLNKFGLNINNKKTTYSEDIISESEKKDKVYLRNNIILEPYSHKTIFNNIKKLYQFNLLFPSSKQLRKEFKKLNEFLLKNNNLSKKKYILNKEEIISILTSIIYTNLNLIPEFVSLLELMLIDEDINFKENIYKKIQNKILKNNERNVYINIWLDNLLIKDKKKDKTEIIKKFSDNNTIWDLSFLNCDEEAKNKYNKLLDIFQKNNVLQLDNIKNELIYDFLKKESYLFGGNNIY